MCLLVKFSRLLRLINFNDCWNKHSLHGKRHTLNIKNCRENTCITRRGETRDGSLYEESIVSQIIDMKI